jgi:acyl carrier protein
MLMVDDEIKRVMAVVLGIAFEDIDDGASTDSIEKWDSLGHLNLMISLENEFGVTFSEEDFSDLTSLELLVLEIKSRLAD